MKRIIAALTALMLLMPSALAETWITVSSWAYNDVSNFKKAGMLPESFDDISDFTQPVTRLQTAQILYSALKHVADDRFTTLYSSNVSDTDDESALQLDGRLIMTGEESGEYDENGIELYYFYPDRLLTREEMAVILDRTAKNYLGYDWTDRFYHEPDDYNEVADWAKDSVAKMMGAGLISGTDNNMFAPKDNLTIEQAITLVYRLYSYLPTGQEADGARLDGKTEETVQTYSNGIEETKKGNMLYLKQNGQILTEFETDIYSNIYCETVDGRIFVAAQNFYGKTDIYDVAEKTITAKLPYPVYSVDSEYITVKSSVIGPFSFGLYDWNGNKVTDTNYSLEELQQLKSNGFSSLTAQYNSPSGMIYFSDWNDGGSLCSIDSNGENKRKLSDKNCVSRIYYLNDRLYYIAEENGIYSLYSVKTDGTGEVKINDYTNLPQNVCFIDKYNSLKIDLDNTSSVISVQTIYNTEDSLNERYIQIAEIDGWIYYLSDNKLYTDGEYNSICRFRINYDNTVEKEQITDEIMYTGFTVNFKDGKVYFMDESKRLKNVDNSNIIYSDLYCFDGKNLTKINGDLPIIDYGFYEDKLLFYVGDNYNDYTVYAAEPDGSNAQVMEDVKEAQERIRNLENALQDSAFENDVIYWVPENPIFVYDKYSDDKYTVLQKTRYVENEYIYESYVKDSSGKEILISENYVNILARYDNVLLYFESDTISNSHDIIHYDMDTGVKRIVANNHYISFEYMADKYLFYYDRNLNIWRYDIENDITEEIAPNSGTYKYGAVYDMFGKNDGMYKLDTDGNYCLVTNREYAANCLYVENGTGKAIHF